MDVDVTPFNPNKAKEWDTFVEASHNGTIFHEINFLRYHNDRFTKHENHLMFHYKNNLIAVLPLTINNKVLRSPYGATYGGFVYAPHTPFSHAMKIHDAFNNYLQENDIEEVYLRSPPFPYQNYPNEYLDYILLNDNYTLINKDLLHVTELENIPDLPPSITKDCRWAVQKAIKSNITITENTDDIVSFYNILLEVYERHGKKPTHTLAELQDLKKRYPNNIRINIAILDEEPIAGICQFICNNKVNLHFYNAHKNKYKTLYPINLLLYHEIEYSIKNGYKYFDFGTSTDGSTWNEKLFTFKESFRSSGVLRKTYYKQINKNTQP